MTRIAILLLLGLCGCADRTSQHYNFTGPTEDAALFVEAIQEWNSTCGYHLTIGGPEGDDIDVDLDLNLDPDPSVRADTYKFAGKTTIYYRYPITAEIFAHELGHSMGLRHVDMPGDLMNPIMQADAHVTPELCRRVDGL